LRTEKETQWSAGVPPTPNPKSEIRNPKFLLLEGVATANGLFYNERNREDQTMRRIRLAAGAACLIVGLVVLYLALVGVSQTIEGGSNCNTVAFSNAAIAQEAASISSVIPIGEDGTLRLRGGLAGKGDIGANELTLVLESQWRFRWRLFGANRWGACSASELNELVRKELVRLTGDDGLQVRQLSGVDVYSE